ncbi:hypothetical protein [Paractinoplanes atraurantiacus]|uniref:Uncharacterized protein n=1 Tax=Paractinoplanes atraurantiacus TaxID=1036182 RepID=A0A285KJM4_9ACTN|nr:hypothetical protein [Actinoplanes atraurantiacus]SNY72834.1 hypothetical protein SAMN05421748_14426 [Actinoplanes atraurantiacus]
MKAPTLVGGSVVTSVVGGISQLAGAPWGAVVTIAIIGLLCTLILGLVQTVIPQESHDKVEFWDKVFAYLERRRTAVPTKKTRPRRAILASPEHDAAVVAPPRSTPTSEQRPACSPARSP